jgi:pyrroloquinoline quinone biosynthesis protein D
VSDHSVAHLAPGHRLHWEQAEHAYALLYPEGMITLDLLAGEVLRRCDGNIRVGEIVQTLLHAHYPDLASRSSILEFIQAAEAKGWIYLT